MAGKINVPVTVALQGLANTQKQLSMLSKGIGGVGKTAGVAALGFAAFAGGVKAADFAMQAISGARDLERNLLGVQTVFEELAPQMRQFTKDAQAMGLGMTDAAKATTFIGSVLKQSGFTIAETADLTERLVGLATDLSITYGYDVQEALLGMTALFRGEYDPIEKFGVAMKQSEINSELAAKGMGNLEGAQRRLAEQQVRVQLLFERSADAQGAMARGAGTLAVEQLKLAASYENIRDTVAVSMLPVIAGIFEDIQVSVENLREPLTELFEAAAPAVRNLAEVLLPALSASVIVGIEALTNFMSIVEQLFDPTTDLGVAVNSLLISLSSLGSTISSSVPGGFDALGSFLELLEAIAIVLGEIVRFLEISAIFWGNFLQAVGSLVDLDPNNFLETDWSGQVAGAIAVRDAYVRQQVAVKGLNFELTRTSDIAEAINKQAAGLSLSNLPKYIRDNLKGARQTTTTTTTNTTATKKEAKNYVKDFFDGIKDEIAQQKARVRLENLGLSEGLIEDILGGQGWEKVFKRVIASGSAGLKKLQADFNHTKAGIAELEKKRQEALEDANEVIRVAQEEADKLKLAYEDAKEAMEDFRRSALEIAQLDILPNVEVELGRFEDQIVTTFRNIQDELARGLGAGTILQADFDTLSAWVKAEEAALRTVSRQRDELANRYVLAESLIKEYRDAFTAGVNLVSMMNRVENTAEKRIVTETSRSVAKLGNGLREFGVTVSRTYEETIENVVGKTDTVLSGFRDMAARAKVFADNLKRLRQMGLDPQLFAQLVQAGVEAGGETAQALVDGGAATITEINSLFKEIDELGKGLGEEVAASLYGSGVNMANGLLEGIQSKQTELETLARSMASAFNTAFQSNLQIAIDKPVAAAKEAADAAQAAVPDIKQINLDNLSTINGLIERATKWLGMTTSAFEQIRTEDILEVYKGLRNDILQGRDINLAGISRGMSPEEAATAARAAGGTTINYSFEIKTDATQSNAMIGKTIENVITAYARTGGGAGAQVAV